MTTGLVVTYLLILGVLYIVGRSFWRPLFAVFQFLFQGALGAALIYLYNLIAANWQFTIPLNPFNVLFTGFLGIPGLCSLLIIKYWFKV